MDLDRADLRWPCELPLRDPIQGTAGLRSGPKEHRFPSVHGWVEREIAARKHNRVASSWEQIELHRSAHRVLRW